MSLLNIKHQIVPLVDFPAIWLTVLVKETKVKHFRCVPPPPSPHLRCVVLMDQPALTATASNSAFVKAAAFCRQTEVICVLMFDSSRKIHLKGIIWRINFLPVLHNSLNDIRLEKPCNFDQTDEIKASLIKRLILILIKTLPLLSLVICDQK